MNGIEKVLSLFRRKSYLVIMGAKKVSNIYNVSVEDVIEARKIYHREKKKIKKANILIFDIETAPLKAYVWSRWKQNIYLDQTISE